MHWVLSLARSLCRPFGHLKSRVSAIEGQQASVTNTGIYGKFQIGEIQSPSPEAQDSPLLSRQV